MTTDFLEFAKNRCNDLTTPSPEFGFSGLQAGDRWYLCALHWKTTWKKKIVPPLILEACEATVLKFVSLEVL